MSIHSGFVSNTSNVIQNKICAVVLFSKTLSKGQAPTTLLQWNFTSLTFSRFSSNCIYNWSVQRENQYPFYKYVPMTNVRAWIKNTLGRSKYPCVHVSVPRENRVPTSTPSVWTSTHYSGKMNDVPWRTTLKWPITEFEIDGRGTRWRKDTAMIAS